MKRSLWCKWLPIPLLLLGCLPERTKQAVHASQDSPHTHQDSSSGRFSVYDSVFQDQVATFTPFELTAQEWTALQVLDEQPWLPLDMGKRLFQRESVSWQSYRLCVHSQDSSLCAERLDVGVDDEGREVFLVVLQAYEGFRGEDFIVVKGTEEQAWVIEQIHAHHFYGLSINSYRHPAGSIVFSFPVNVARGAGIWEFRRFYYEIEGLTIHPVLQVLSHSKFDLGLSGRAFSLDTRIVNTDPLTIRFYPENRFLGIDTQDSSLSHATVLNDSIDVLYEWIAREHRYVPRFPKTLSADKLSAYSLYVPSDSMFVAAYKADLMQLAETGPDSVRRAVNAFLYSCQDSAQ